MLDEKVYDDIRDFAAIQVHSKKHRLLQHDL
jgi:hypothetical protein